MDEMAHTSINLPKPLHRALKVKLAAEDKSLSQWAREHAEADTKEQPKGKKK